MTQKVWIVVIVGVLVSVVMLKRLVCATSTVNLRRIITFEESIDLTTTLGYLTALSVVQASGSTVRYNLWFINALVVELPFENIAGALYLLQSSLDVAEVSEDPVGSVGRITPTFAPTAEDRDWGVKRIKAPEVYWRWGLTGYGVQVAILDTGIDGSHPDLQVDGGYNALTKRELNNANDDNGHGTHMAGIISATFNQHGIVGVAPRASLWAVKVLDRDGVGYLSNFLRGMQWLYEKTGIRLANMSFGFWDNYGPLERATKRLYERGVLMVASAGNRCSASLPGEEGGGGDGEGCEPSQIEVTYPARYPWVISVGATDFYDRMASYSRSGKVDIAGPGGSRETGIQILSTNRDGGYGYSRGTSPAAAHVTGVLALVLDLRPRLSFKEAVALLTTARELSGYAATEQGHGLIDAAAMLEAVQ